MSAIFITGMGAVTPLGPDLPSYWQALLAGRSGVRHISLFDASRLPTRVAAEVRELPAELPQSLKRAPRFMRFAWAAAAEAMAAAGEGLLQRPERVGLVMATAMGGASFLAQAQEKLARGRSAKVSPYLVPFSLGNMAAAHVAISQGIRGPSLTVSTACSAGGDACGVAAMLLEGGMADAVLVLGGESILCELTVSSLSQAGALSRRNESPASACRPFDLSRDGFVIGEGGGALVLERADHARARGARPLARLAAHANTADAHHITAPDPSGQGAAACMKLALRRAGLEPADIGYINAHGTATQLGDEAEARACREVFGSCIPPMSSTKGATGHLMGAGGLTELAACVMALREGWLPPTINYGQPDPNCDFDCVPNVARRAAPAFAMSNAMGFGGQNSSIVLAAE